MIFTEPEQRVRIEDSHLFIFSTCPELKGTAFALASLSRVNC
jgi:hypothetical protein